MGDLYVHKHKPAFNYISIRGDSQHGKMRNINELKRF